MPQPDKLYRGFTEEKWKERLYRAYRYSSEPTKALWDMLRPFLEATDELESYKHTGDEWHPIETAPKDGTVIDLLVKGERVPDAYWSFSRNADGTLHPTAYDCWALKGQYTGMGGVYPVGVGGEPTHWKHISPTKPTGKD